MSALLNIKEKKTVVEYISKVKAKEMEDSRIALQKIFSTVIMMAKQGLAFRGNTSESEEISNLTEFLKMRSEDVPILANWINNKNKSKKWLSHDIINKILDIAASDVVRINIEAIKSAIWYGITMDGTTDTSKQEQESIGFRIVDENLTVRELFMGFYQATSTKAETLFGILKDILVRFDLNINCLRGQCYDGASNVSGRLTGLQTRVQEVEPRGIFVHCNGHNLNLSVQDSLESIPCTRNCIGIAKDLINFVHDSPKRLAWFKELQTGEKAPQLMQFCPTRY